MPGKGTGVVNHSSDHVGLKEISTDRPEVAPLNFLQLQRNKGENTVSMCQRDVEVLESELDLEKPRGKGDRTMQQWAA